MDELNNQTVDAEKVSKQSAEENEEKKAESRLEKIISRLAKFTGDEKKAKMIVGLFMFFTVAFLLIIVSSLFRKGPPRSKKQPEPIPTPIPIIVTPTPRPTITPDEIDYFIEDVIKFDTNQNDLLPPEVDLEISI